MINYEHLFKETVDYYFKGDFRLPPMDDIKVKTRKIEATTIDEYLVCLNKGYINVTIAGRLEHYLVELLKDDWFHQWSPIRWAYASRRLYRIKAPKEDIQHALDIIVPLANKGYPCALADLAFCYYYGRGVERSYEKAICLWIVASAKGLHRAQQALESEYNMGRMKDLPEELRLFFARQLIRKFVREYNVQIKDSKPELNGLPLYVSQTLTRLYREHARLCKLVPQKASLRQSSNLWWNDKENPYSIGTKWK